VEPFGKAFDDVAQGQSLTPFGGDRGSAIVRPRKLAVDGTRSISVIA
jgi:hypothetical protein